MYATRQAIGRARSILIGLVGLCFTCHFLLGIIGTGASDSIDSHAVVGMQGNDATTRRIEDVRVGDRVVTEIDANLRRIAVGNGVEEWDLKELRPANWRRLELQLQQDMQVVNIVLLRPVKWVAQFDVRVGHEVPIVLPEHEIGGVARVLDIGPCPPIESGRGSIVTGTFSHVHHGVLQVHLDGDTAPIGVTANHPIYSMDREQFVRAGELRPGEKLQTRSTIARVAMIASRSGPSRVFNLEVLGDHVYRVHERGVLVHNDCPVFHGTDSASAASINRKGLNSADWHAAGGGAGVDPKGFSVTSDKATARAWAEVRAGERGGDAVVLEANPNDLPLRPGAPGEWADPNESFIHPDDFPKVPPGTFKPSGD